jgi:LysM repeat protein
MNTPSPLIPQGSLPEAAKRKANIRIAIFTILAIHAALLGGLLMQGGCKPEDKQQAKADLTALTNDTSLPVIQDSNYVSRPVTPTDTNAAPAPADLVTGPEGQPSAPGPGGVAEAKEYTIAKGDTLVKIARAHGVTVKAIEEANPGIVPTRLKINQRIQIPAAAGTAGNPKAEKLADTAVAEPGVTWYTVKARDSLFKIARQQGTTVRAIKSLNHLKTDQLRIGQRLKLPPAKVATETATIEPANIPATIATSSRLPAGNSNTANPAR